MQETIKNINRSKKLPLGKLPLGNILYLFLDKIAKSEWMPFIRESFEKSGKHISEAFASQVCDTVECHSWYLQQLCYFIWNATTGEEGRTYIRRSRLSPLVLTRVLNP